MNRLSYFAFAFAVAWATACGGNSSAKKDTVPPNLGADGTTGGDAVVAAPALPVIPAEPVPAPASLLAEISLGNPNMQLGQIGSFVDAVQPGMGAMLTPQQMLGGLGSIVGADALAGVDLEKPLYVLVHDDKAVPGGFVLVVPVADEAALRTSVEGGAQPPPAAGAPPTPGKAMILLHDGYAAIGQREALEAGAPYGLTTRLQANTVPELQVRVHMKTVMANYGEQLATQLQTQMGPGAEHIVGALRQIDELVGTVVVDHTAAGLELSAKIASGGTLSQFIAAQKPSTFSMVPHVGTGPWPIFIAGYLDTSTLAPAMAELAKAMGDQMAGMMNMNVKGGELAIGSNVTAGSVEQIVAVFDSADAVTLKAEADKAMKLLAGKSKDLGTAEIDVTFKANAMKVRGGSLHSITYKPKKSLTPERKKELAETFGKAGLTAYFGVVGSRFIGVYGKNAKKLARQVAKPKASGKGKGVQLQSAIDTAQARGESLVIAIDLAALSGSRPAKDVAPLVVGVSFGTDQADVRITMPVEQVKELQAQGM